MIWSQLFGWLPAALALAFTPAAPAQTAAEFLEQGVKLFQKGSPEAAIESLENAVAAEPKQAAAWKVLGVVYASRKNYAGAEPAFRRACSLEPKLPDACFYHARTLYLVNRFTEALAILRTLVSDPRRHRIQALCFDALGQWAEAEAHYRQAVDADPGPEDPRVDYAVALSRQGRAQEAAPLLRLSIKSGKQPQRAELELGRVLLHLGLLNDARTHLERAVALTPRSSQAHLLLGRLYSRLGLVEEAARQLELGAQGAQLADENVEYLRKK